jgi:DNA-binding MarR family transcriptional regulator
MAKAPAPPRAEEWVELEEVLAVAEFRAALRAFMHRSERVLRSCGLTPQRYMLLVMIKGAADGSERVTFSRLADRMRIERNTATELVQRAEDAGLVEREPSTDDGRVVYLRLTELGEERLGQALHASRSVHEEFARELEAMTDAFRRI